MCEISREASLEIFNKLMDLQENTVTRDVYDHCTNIRTSEKKDKMIEEELKLWRSVGIRMSKNDLYNFAMDILLAYRQNPSTYIHYRSKNEMTTFNFIEEHRDEIINRVRLRLFQKQMDILMGAPSKSKKEKKTKTQKVSRIKEQIESMPE